MTLFSKSFFVALLVLSAFPGWREARADTHDDAYREAEVRLNPQTRSVEIKGIREPIAGPFAVNERTSGDITINTTFHPELANHTEAYLDATAGYIKYFANKIGEYPYSRFTIVSTPAPIGIAFPGLTVMNRRILALPFILNTSLPHEILHSWWGGAVGIEVETGNWAEGLTTYMVDGDDDLPNRTRPARDVRLEWLRNYAALSPLDDITLSNFRSKTHDRSQVIGYGKAAFVFHMLKNEVGTEVFERALGRFYTTNRFKTAGWLELEQAFTQEAGFNLAPFFHQWVARRGASTLTAKAKRTPGGVQLTLRQKDLVDKGRGFFLRLPVEITTQAGVERQTVMMKGSGQTFNLKTQSPVTAVHVDPDFDIFRRLSRGEAPVILRDITLAQNATLIVPESDPAWFSALEALSRRLLGNAPGTVPSKADGAIGSVPANEPLIIGGTKAAVHAFLDKSDLPTSPMAPIDDAAADSRVWTARDKTGRALLVLEAPDLAALAAMARALPHYKRQSWVAFANGRAAGRGVWAMTPDGPGGLRIALP